LEVKTSLAEEEIPRQYFLTTTMCIMSTLASANLHVEVQASTKLQTIKALKPLNLYFCEYQIFCRIGNFNHFVERNKNKLKLC